MATPKKAASAAKSLFPQIEALLDAGDREGARKLLAQSRGELEALAQKPGKAKADAEKALRAYELASDLVEHLFGVKEQLAAQQRGRR